VPSRKHLNKKCATKLFESILLLETLQQLSERSGLSIAQVRGLIATGRLAHVRVGSRLLIPKGAFEEFIQAETVKPCRDENRGRNFDGSMTERVGTSFGQSEVEVASAARAR
jgi:excisionase family DNA binding protein